MRVGTNSERWSPFHLIKKLGSPWILLAPTMASGMRPRSNPLTVLPAPLPDDSLLLLLSLLLLWSSLGLSTAILATLRQGGDPLFFDPPTESDLFRFLDFLSSVLKAKSRHFFSRILLHWFSVRVVRTWLPLASLTTFGCLGLYKPVDFLLEFSSKTSIMCLETKLVSGSHELYSASYPSHLTRYKVFPPAFRLAMIRSTV